MEKYSEIPVDKLREDLADLEHEQWIDWSKNIADLNDWSDGKSIGSPTQSLLKK